MVKSIPTYVILLRSYCVRKVENSALQHVLYVLSFLSKTDCKALLPIRMDTQQHIRLDGITTLLNSLLQMVACPCGLAEVPCSVSGSGRTAHRAHVVRPNSWDKGVLTDLCLTGVLTDLCLTLYIH